VSNSNLAPNNELHPHVMFRFCYDSEVGRLTNQVDYMSLLDVNFLKINLSVCDCNGVLCLKFC